MRRIIFSGLVVLIGMSQVACSKNNKDNQAAVNQCLFDPTGMCPRQVAAYLQGTNMAALQQPGIPGINPPNTQGAFPGSNLPGMNTTTLPAGGSIPGLTVASNGQVALPGGSLLRAQADRIASQIQSIAANPNSSYYIPPQAPVPSGVARAEETSRAPASVTSGASEGESSGDIAR